MVDVPWKCMCWQWDHAKTKKVCRLAKNMSITLGYFVQHEVHDDLQHIKECLKESMNDIGIVCHVIIPLAELTFFTIKCEEIKHWQKHGKCQKKGWIRFHSTISEFLFIFSDKISSFENGCLVIRFMKPKKSCAIKFFAFVNSLKIISILGFLNERWTNIFVIMGGCHHNSQKYAMKTFYSKK